MDDATPPPTLGPQLSRLHPTSWDFDRHRSAMLRDFHDLVREGVDPELLRAEIAGTTRAMTDMLTLGGKDGA